MVEIRIREQRETILRRGRESSGLSACGHAAHEYAIVLRVDHGRTIAQQRSFADYARIVRQNRDPTFWTPIQKPQHQLIDQRRFAGTAGTGESDDARSARISNFLLGRWALGVERLPRRSVAKAGSTFNKNK